MRALIKQESSPRNTPSDPLIANDVVNIAAIMPSINRVLENFLLQSPLTIRYPLEMHPPVYLQTVSVGDVFTVQWKASIISEAVLEVYQNSPS